MEYNKLPGLMKYYQCVRDHYPIGLFPQSYWYFATEEAKQLYQKITERETTKQFQDWNDLIHDLKTWDDFVKVEAVKDNSAPGLGIKATLLTDKFFQSISEIYIFISLLGPYYYYFGKETGNEKWGYKDRSVIVFSPFDHYEKVFQKLETILLSALPTFSYIPHRMGIHQIDGLYDPYSISGEEEPKSMCLFQALFNYKDIRNYLDIGDLSYRRESWGTYRWEHVAFKKKFEHIRSGENSFDL